MWQTKRWVKMPIAEPLDLLACSWQARGLYRLLQTKADNGVIRLGRHGLEGLSLVVGAPWNEIEKFVQEIISAGIFVTNFDAIFDTQNPEAMRALNGAPVPDAEIPAPKNKNEKEIEKKKKKRGRPPADSRHNAMIDLFFSLWLELRGGDKYEVQARDAAAVSRFLKGHPETTLQEIERRMRLAFATPWFCQNGDIAIFVSQWSKYDRVIGFPGRFTPVPQPATTVTDVGFDPITNEVLRSDGTRRPA